MQFYSQVGQDRYLLENFFRGKRKGVFLDIGAYDGEKFSNTLFFERSLDWSGLCVEPLPSAFAELTRRRRARCENVAVSDFEGEADFVDCDAGIDEKMLSGLACRFDTRHRERLRRVSSSSQKLRVPVTTLSALLTRHGLFHVDYCSLDTEGAELSVLSGFDPERFDISVFSIEDNYGENQIPDLMKSKGYELVCRLEQDYIFRRSDVRRLPRISVICAVWHGDPERQELLRSHQENLAAQTVPVEPVYVFDGGDSVPEWLWGKAVSVRESLTMYQAWNVALSMVETPLVMNLNLDDRLAPDGAVKLERAVLEHGAAAAGGEWRVCCSQAETDAVEPCFAAAELAFDPAWPPVGGRRRMRLGSGTGERGTFGPATLWRMDAHLGAPRYPWRLADGTLLRGAADAAWWMLLQNHLHRRMVRLPLVVGNYHSHPADQAEFRPAEYDETSLLRNGGEVSLL